MPDIDPPPAEAGTHEVLTADEAAALLRVSASRIIEMANDGHVPGRRLGRRWRFSRATLLRWLAGEDVPLPRPQPPQRRPVSIIDDEPEPPVCRPRKQWIKF